MHLNYHSNNLLLDNKQAPITPALACNLDNTTAESLLTKFKEYLVAKCNPLSKPKFLQLQLIPD